MFGEQNTGEASAMGIVHHERLLLCGQLSLQINKYRIAISPFGIVPLKISDRTCELAHYI